MENHSSWLLTKSQFTRKNKPSRISQEKIRPFTGLSIKAITRNTCHGRMMLQVNWPVEDTIHVYSNKFVTGVKIKATNELKHNDAQP